MVYTDCHCCYRTFVFNSLFPAHTHTLDQLVGDFTRICVINSSNYYDLWCEFGKISHQLMHGFTEFWYDFHMNMNANLWHELSSDERKTFEIGFCSLIAVLYGFKGGLVFFIKKCLRIIIITLKWCRNLSRSIWFIWFYIFIWN